MPSITEKNEALDIVLAELKAGRDKPKQVMNIEVDHTSTTNVIGSIIGVSFIVMVGLFMLLMSGCSSHNVVVQPFSVSVEKVKVDKSQPLYRIEGQGVNLTKPTKKKSCNMQKALTDFAC